MSRKKILKKEHLRSFLPKTIGDRINVVIADNELNGRKFCDIVEISSGNLSAIINDDSKPSAALLFRILDRFSVDTNWLLSGKGSMYLKNSASENNVAELFGPSAQSIKDGMQETNGAIDAQLLADCIETVETVLKQIRKQWPLKKKARFIALQYEYYMDSGKNIDIKEVATRLRLVA